MGYKVYTNEFKAEVSKFYQTHTIAETMSKYGVSDRSVTQWSRKLGYPAKPSGVINFPDDFKHEVCQYYDNHTWKETIEKYDISSATLFQWRKTYGYRNKSRGYNLYTQEYRKEARAPLHFKSVRGEDGKYKLEVLQKRITDLEAQIATMQPDVELAQSIRNLFN